jgi:hypothetical protein
VGAALYNTATFGRIGSDLVFEDLEKAGVVEITEHGNLMDW